MSEQPSLFEYPDWKEQTDRTSFSTTRGDIIRTGTEVTVYQHSGLLVVIKEFFKERTRGRYTTAATLIPDIVAPFEFIQDFPINVDGITNIVRDGVAQARRQPLDGEFLKAIQQRNAAGMVEVVQKFASIDRAILGRGVFLPDPGYANYGFDDSRIAQLTDAGGAITEFSDLPQYLAYNNGRGKIHYAQYLALRMVGRKYKLNFQRHPLEEVYSSATGLSFDPSMDSLIRLQVLLSTNRHGFFPVFSELGQQEFERFAPHGAPFSREEQIRFFELLPGL